jgi:protein TonB
MSPHLPRLAALCAVAIAACSQSDQPNPNKVPPAARIEAPKAPSAPEAPSSAAEIDPALRDRLARQEAAARMFEKNVLQPQPPKAATAPGPAPEPVKAAPEPAKAVPEPPRTPPREVRTETSPPPAAPKAAAPPKAEPPPPPRTDVAAAKPSAAPVQTATAAATKLISRVDPDFPREAVQAGVEKGNVKARMTLDETGAVTRVEVVEAMPRRVFDRAVVRALTQWRFNEGAAGRTVDTEVDFHR